MARFMEPEEYQKYLESIENAPATEESVEESLEKQEVLVSLYKMNQDIIRTMPDMTDEQLMFARETFKDWVAAHRDTYYMLLCNELHYYTVFRFPYVADHISDARYTDFWTELMDVMSYVGPAKIIEEDTNGMMSIWATARQDEDVHCFYLFPYGQGVVEV